MASEKGRRPLGDASATTIQKWVILADLFLRRFREGISFPNFVERSFMSLPLSKLCAMHFALQDRARLEGEKMAKR